MSEHPIESLMSSVLENLKKVGDANTVIGEPIFRPVCSPFAMRIAEHLRS